MSTNEKGSEGASPPTDPGKAQFGRLADGHCNGHGNRLQSGYVSADTHRKRLSEAANEIGHDLNIADSSIAVRDDRMLARAFRMILIAATASVEKSGELIEVAAQEERLGEFCRHATSGSVRHG